MLTGELRSQVDAIWNAFWSGGISNPMEVLEQITYLLFIRRLDDAHTREESKALVLGTPQAMRVFPQALTPRAALIQTCAGRTSRTSPRPRCTPWWASMCSPFCVRAC